jgi:purine-nucleoside phosphorylase
VITDMCLPDALEPADIDRIIATANSAEPKLLSLVTGVLEYVAAGRWRKGG